MQAQKIELKKASPNTQHVLVTDVRHDYLLKIFKEKCIGEVSLFGDKENKNIVDGVFLGNGKAHKNYSWKWAHKIFYSYDRLTSMVGKREFNGFFVNEGRERIYIFENLSSNDFYVIKNVVKEHCLMFNIKKDDMISIDALANITHNYYAAWARLHYLALDYDGYLNGAKEQLIHLKFHLSEFKEIKKLIKKIDYYIENTEAFKADSEIRLKLLAIFYKTVKVADYSAT